MRYPASLICMIQASCRERVEAPRNSPRRAPGIAIGPLAFHFLFPWVIVAPRDMATLNQTAASEVACEALPSWGLLIGVAMGVFGSIGINIGQNIQARGIAQLDEAGLDVEKPCRSRTWVAGLSIFITFSLVNFAAFGLAPASVLTPLESIQFVTNIFYNRFVNGVTITGGMHAGVSLTVVGTLLTVIFGADGGGGCNSVATLESYWTAWPWWLWLGVSLSSAASAYAAHRLIHRKLARGERIERHAIWLPITFTLYSALAGGAQMIVHSKILSELLGLIVQVGAAPTGCLALAFAG